MFLLTLLLFNDAFPFTGGGDDEDYYYASLESFTNFGDWFDTTQYEYHEQAGYPLLLSWVHQVSGDSLFHRKALNVFFMLVLAIVWFAIGKLIDGKRLAFVYAYGILLATPLWYYWLFLLKDMAITLLQSLFILGLIQFASGERRFRGYALIALSTLALIPFRSILAVFNLALVVAFTLLQGRSRTSGISFGTRLILVASLVVGLWLLSVQPGMMETLGAKGEDRSLMLGGLQSLTERAETERQQFSGNPLTFPILFLVGETDALNPSNWGQFDLALLRPLSMVPWIFLGLPFFLAGVATMLRRGGVRKMFASGMRHSDDNGTTEDYSRRQTLCLRVLLIFIVGYVGIGWLSGTTTRWTLPAIPPMIGIAGFAWTNMNNHARVSLLTAFGFSLLALIFLYYWMLK